jgi:hypothetical protein
LARETISRETFWVNGWRKIGSVYGSSLQRLQRGNIEKGWLYLVGLPQIKGYGLVWFLFGSFGLNLPFISYFVI